MNSSSNLRAVCTDHAFFRYVERLEQQQSWLVHALQKLYRRIIDGKGWPGDRLHPESNAQSLTHDLLMRLGVIDDSKGERFVESTAALQQVLWRTNDGMQRQQSPHGSLDIAQSPAASSHLSADGFPMQRKQHTPPTYSSWMEAPINKEPNMSPTASSMCMQGAPSPLEDQAVQQWASECISPFDEVNMMTTGDYYPCMINRQLPLDYNMPEGLYFSSTNDCGNLNQIVFLHQTESAQSGLEELLPMFNTP